MVHLICANSFFFLSQKPRRTGFHHYIKKRIKGTSPNNTPHIHAPTNSYVDVYFSTTVYK